MIPHHVTDGASGEAVVLLNSLGTTLDMWRPQVAALAEHFRVVRFDTRGHGRTPAPPGEWTVSGLAGDVIDLLDHLGFERAHLVGVSLGGATALDAAARWPGRVARLGLISTAAKIGTPESWSDRAATVRDQGCHAISAAAMDRWFSPAFHAAHPEAVAAFRERFDASDPGGYAACCDALGRMDLRGDLAEVAAETLIMVGTADEVTTVTDAHYLAGALPGGRVIPFDGAKHLLTTEYAAECNRHLIDFLTGTRTQA